MKKSKILCIAIIIMALSLQSISAFVYVRYYSATPLYAQEQTNWCWNASARMAADYDYNVNKSQQDAANMVVNGQNSGITSPSTECDAMEFFTNYTKNATYTMNPGSYNGVEFSIVASKLYNSNNPITMGTTHNYFGMKHIVAVIGYNDSSTNYIYINDPERADRGTQYIAYNDLQRNKYVNFICFYY